MSLVRLNNKNLEKNPPSKDGELPSWISNSICLSKHFQIGLLHKYHPLPPYITKIKQISLLSNSVITKENMNKFELSLI